MKNIKKQIATGWNTWDTQSKTSYVLLPCGLSIKLSFKDYSVDRIVKNSNVEALAQDYKVIPQPRTYNGDYTELEIHFAQSRIKVQQTILNGELLIVVTPLETGLNAPVLIAEVGYLWGYDGCLEKKDGIICAKNDAKEYCLYTNGESVKMPYAFANTFYMALKLDKPLYLSTAKININDATNAIACAKSAMDKSDEKFGKNKELVRAMRACLAWNTIYEPEYGDICTPVSRSWNVDWGGFVLFPWDGFFVSLMLAYESTELAMLNTAAVLNGITEDGFVPNFRCANGCISADRSNPPVGSFACLEIYKKCKDKHYLEYVYKKLCVWNDWFWQNRRVTKGALAWGSSKPEIKFGKNFETYFVNTTQGATFESGMDHLSVYNGIEFDKEKGIMMLEDISITSLYWLDCSSLYEMSLILGKNGDRFKCRMNDVKNALSNLWDEKQGVFASRRTDNGKFCDHIGPMCFWPIVSGCHTQEQLNAMLKNYFYNPEHFFGEYMLPTVSKSDSGYMPDEPLFRGRIWPPVNFLTYIALKSAGCKKECEILAQKNAKMLLNEWQKHRHIHENTHTDTGNADLLGSYPLYGWGALNAYMALDFENSK